MKIDTTQGKTFTQATKHFARKGVNRSHQMTRLEKLWWPDISWAKYFIVRISESGLLYGAATFNKTRKEEHADRLLHYQKKIR